MRSFGTITPSSNIVVEQVTFAMVRDLPEISPHFARFGYAGSTTQFENDYDWERMLEAARLLADARLDAICWNGSRGGTLGFDRDRLLCERITAAHGLPATTSTLALDELLRASGLHRIGFVTPYVDALNEQIAKVWGAGGYNVAATIGDGLTDNSAYSTMPSERLWTMAMAAAETRPEALVFYCTNMRAAELCPLLEAKLGIPVLDAVSAGVWKALKLIGDRSSLGKWGQLLS